MSTDASEAHRAGDPVKRVATRGKWIKTGFCYLAVVLCIFLPVALSLRKSIKGRPNDPKRLCLNNLRYIEGAKEEWALDQQKSTNAMPTWEELRGSPTRKYLRIMPECPAGGTYTIGPLSVPPVCSVLPHSLGFLTRTLGTNLACQESLAVLQVAKNEWQLRNSGQGAPALKQLLVLIYLEADRRGFPDPPELPNLNCEAGGTFLIGGVGEKPRCSVPGHTLL